MQRTEMSSSALSALFVRNVMMEDSCLQQVSQVCPLGAVHGAESTSVTRLPASHQSKSFKSQQHRQFICHSPSHYYDEDDAEQHYILPHKYFFCLCS